MLKSELNLGKINGIYEEKSMSNQPAILTGLFQTESSRGITEKLHVLRILNVVALNSFFWRKLA